MGGTALCGISVQGGTFQGGRGIFIITPSGRGTVRFGPVLKRILELLLEARGVEMPGPYPWR